MLLSCLRLHFFHHVCAPTRTQLGHNDDVIRRLLVIFEQSSLSCEAMQRGRKTAPEHVLAIELHGKYEGYIFFSSFFFFWIRLAFLEPTPQHMNGRIESACAVELHFIKNTHFSRMFQYKFTCTRFPLNNSLSHTKLILCASKMITC